MAGGELDPSKLRPKFQEGLEALQEAVEERDLPTDADVRAIDDPGSDVIVRLGTWPADRYREWAVDYVDDEFEVYVKIPARFPVGDGKGFIASPPLRREDGSLNNNPWQQNFAQPVAEDTGKEAECYSHNWANNSMSDPEDMVKFLDVADEFLSRG